MSGESRSPDDQSRGTHGRREPGWVPVRGRPGRGSDFGDALRGRGGKTGQPGGPVGVLPTGDPFLPGIRESLRQPKLPGDHSRGPEQPGGEKEMGRPGRPRGMRPALRADRSDFVCSHR